MKDFVSLAIVFVAGGVLGAALILIHLQARDMAWLYELTTIYNRCAHGGFCGYDANATVDSVRPAIEEEAQCARGPYAFYAVKAGSVNTLHVRCERGGLIGEYSVSTWRNLKTGEREEVGGFTYALAKYKATPIGSLGALDMLGRRLEHMKEILRSFLSSRCRSWHCQLHRF